MGTVGIDFRPTGLAPDLTSWSSQTCRCLGAPALFTRVTQTLAGRLSILQSSNQRSALVRCENISKRKGRYQRPVMKGTLEWARVPQRLQPWRRATPACNSKRDGMFQESGRLFARECPQPRVLTAPSSSLMHVEPGSTGSVQMGDCRVVVPQNQRRQRLYIACLLPQGRRLARRGRSISKCRCNVAYPKLLDVG